MLKHLNEKVVRPARVVIVGSGGFVGGAIRRHVLDAGIEVLGLARTDIDLLREDAGDRLAERLRPDDAVVMASAIAPCKSPAMLRDNIVLAEAFARAISRQPVSYILNIGSDAIYADSQDPLNEDSCAAPTSLHGIMHWTREIIVGDAAGDTPMGTLRPTLIYGVDDPHNGYGPNRFRRLAADGQDIVLFGEGEERRDHVFIEDVASLAALMIGHRSIGALNAATGTVISFREVAELINSHFENAISIKGSPRSGPMPHDGYRPFDPSATQAAFPEFVYTQPSGGFASICQDTVEPT